MTHRLLRLAALSLAIGSGMTATVARSAPAPGVDRERLDQRRPTPRRLHRAPQPPTPPKTPRSFQPFVLTAVRLEGSTASPAVVDDAIRPFVGRTIDAKALQALTDVVGKAHEQRADVALYTVLAPDQDFSGGVVRLTIIEGYIEEVAIQGAQGHGVTLVKAYARKLAAERPLKRSTLQRYSALIRDIPGLNPELQLIAGQNKGAVRLVIELHPHPVQVALGVNNRGTAFLGRAQFQGDLYLNSLLTQGDQTRLSVATASDTSLFQYYSAAHSRPLGGDGASLVVSGGYLHTRPKSSGLDGHAASLGVQVSYPLIRDDRRSLYLTAGLDGLNADNALFGFTFSDDRSRALRIGAIWSQTGASEQSSLSAAASFGLDALGAHAFDPRVTQLKFVKLNLRGAYDRQLAKSVILRLAATAQLSGDRLPASELMTLGGEDFGRAYEAAFVTGDYGYAGSAELALRPSRLPHAVEGSEAYLFADDGRVWSRARLGFPTQRYDVASAGGGMRVTMAAHAVLQLEAARGLTNPLPFEDREHWRGVVSVRTLF